MEISEAFHSELQGLALLLLSAESAIFNFWKIDQLTQAETSDAAALPLYTTIGFTVTYQLFRRGSMKWMGYDLFDAN